MDDFFKYTDEEKRLPFYAACVGSWIAAGAIGTGGNPVGIVAGGIMGYLTCDKIIDAAITHKLKYGQALTERESLKALQAIRRARPMISKREAMLVLANLRKKAIHQRRS